MRTVALSGSMVLGILCAACSSGNALNIGDERNEPLGALLSDYSGGWLGYTEAYRFASGSDQVHLILDAEGGGTLEYGDQPLLGPPTDPNVPYPDRSLYPSRESPLWPLEGVLLPVDGAAVTARRIELKVNGLAYARPWCQLQTSVANQAHSMLPEFEPEYICGREWVPTESPSYQTQWFAQYDCEIICSCDASSCDLSSSRRGAQVGLDGALSADGEELVGTILFLESERVTVRLTRQ